jgi:hypothetical protein
MSEQQAPSTLSLRGEVSERIQQTDIRVLREQLEPDFRRLNLTNDQVPLFVQMGIDRQQARENLLVSATRLGIDPAAQTQALELSWQRFACEQLNRLQQVRPQALLGECGGAISPTLPAAAPSMLTQSSTVTASLSVVAPDREAPLQPDGQGLAAFGGVSAIVAIIAGAIAWQAWAFASGRSAASRTRRR